MLSSRTAPDLVQGEVAEMDPVLADLVTDSLSESTKVRFQDWGLLGASSNPWIHNYSGRHHSPSVQMGSPRTGRRHLRTPECS